MRSLIPAALALSMLAAPALAEQVGEFSNDWVGNGVEVEAFPDPGVQGVTCHVAHFSRSLIDRVTKGNWFEDPSNASIACRQTGPLAIGDIETDEEGEDIFGQRLSLVFKSLAVRRIWDQKNQTLIYVVYSKQITEGSAKIAISTVSTFNQDVRKE
ncbi:MAG TPA: CreA family protein [Geminicoccus sp.]|uniref:CreA family protein n=1 Tax=Geminicoccus sp. TaxID=2024832 RepID=UPI002E36EE59|nr:CreA family protein [Geminicoccus sp.]HEX2529194.1 CreA family protein [Geminicoccus sp.]